MKGEMMKRFLASVLTTFALIGAAQAHAIPTTRMSNKEVKEILTTAHTDYIEGTKKLSLRDPHDQRARLRLSKRLFETLMELKEHYPSIAEELIGMFYGEDLKIIIGEDNLKKCKVNLIINQFGLIDFELYVDLKCIFIREI